MKINLQNKTTQQIEQVKVGFSWTTLFFGFFPAFFRGDWKWGLIQLLVACLTCFLSNIVFAFIYNKIYINELLEKNFIAADEFSEKALQAKGFIARNTPQKNNSIVY